MAKMTPTNWEHANAEGYDPEAERVEWIAGQHALKITRVVYHPDEIEENPNTYAIYVKSLDGEDEGATAKMMYFLYRKNTKEYNNYTLGTLNSLWRAIYGEGNGVGIPYPDDAIGCVVSANVELDGTYPRVYKFDPAPVEYAMYSDKMDSQYFAESE